MNGRRSNGAVPFINVYKLKLRGKKDRIYFLPDRQEAPLYGIFQQGPEVAEALKKKSK